MPMACVTSTATSPVAPALDEAKTAVQIEGFPDAFVVGSVNGHIIPAEDADGLLKE